jgi:hypothetical protein
MPKRALSITLGAGNVTWLKGRAGATGESVSELVDQIVTSARQDARSAAARSVAGTILIDAADPLLETSDATVRAAFDASLGRPAAVREGRSAYRAGRKTGRRRRG